MATYKGIQGYTVQKLSSDPTASEAEGQLWYNSSTGKFKIAVAGAGAWASGTPFNTGRAQMGCAGDTSTAVIFGGDTGGPAPALCEAWNGTAWTETTNIPTGAFRATGLGTSTAAVSVGGTPSPTVGVQANKWDGTSWSVTGSLNNSRGSMGSAGTTTAGMVFGGGDYSAETETFDGTSWTEVADLNLARHAGASTTKGTTTAAMYSGGSTGPSPPTRRTPNSETWDGTSWSEGNNLTTSRGVLAGCGITTAAMAFGGGYPGTTRVAVTETYNGTSWTEVADLASAANWPGGIGAAATSAFCVGGNTDAAPNGSTNAEEWADPAYTNKTVTVS
jgi:hypothetical protein